MFQNTSATEHASFLEKSNCTDQVRLGQTVITYMDLLKNKQ
jgi:hypothetical protein